MVVHHTIFLLPTRLIEEVESSLTVRFDAARENHYPGDVRGSWDLSQRGFEKRYILESV